MGATTTTHGESWAGNRSPEYTAWVNMRYRCNNPGAAAYPDYGARGITVCERWGSFEAFLADVGRRPSSIHSLDRIDNDRGYEPGNVRWATPQEQLRNRRNIKLTASDVAAIRARADASQRRLAIEFGVSQQTISRIRRREVWA